MTVIHDLYPALAVREALLRANAGAGFMGLREAAAICRSPSELRYVVLGFKGWRHSGGSGPEGVSRLWGEMAGMSGVLTRVKGPSVFYPPGSPAPDDTAGQPPTRAAAPTGIDLQGVESALADAFGASVALQEERDRAAIDLGLPLLPRDFVLTQLGLEGSKFDEALKRLTGRSPFDLLARNLEALSAALPPAACQARVPTHMAVDQATVARLRRLWFVLCKRLTRAVPEPTHDSGLVGPTSGASLAARFTRAVGIACQRAFDLLWPRQSLQPEPPLTGWLADDERTAGTGIGRSDDWWSLTADLLASGLPLPGEMPAMLLSAFASALLDLDSGDVLRPAWRDSVLMAMLTDDAKGRRGFLDALAAAENPASHWGSIAASWSLAEALQLERAPLPARLLHELARDHELVGSDQCPPWEGDWVQRWWFGAYQQRIRSWRVLPTPLGPTEPLPDGWEPDWVFMGFDPGEHPPADVDASALWCLWHLMRDSHALIPDPDRQSAWWPVCIRRLAREGYESTAIHLFSCWLMVGVIRLLTRTSEAVEGPGLPSTDDDWFRSMPEAGELLDLVRDLQGRVGPRQLDGVLCVAAACLRQAGPRHGWTAEQLEVRSDISWQLAPERVAEVVTLARMPSPEAMLIRDRLSESMRGYKLLPPAYQKDLLQAERIRYVSQEYESGEKPDSTGADPPRAMWAHHYTTLIERAVRDGLRRLRAEDVRRAYEQGGGRREEWRADAVTLGQFRLLVAGALQTEDLQQRFKVAGFSVARLNEERLNWLVRCRNDAAHAQGLALDRALGLRAWMNESFFDLICALGLAQSQEKGQ